MDAGRISIGHQPVVPRSPGERAAQPADSPATRAKIAAFHIAVPPTSHGMHARRGSAPVQPASAAGAHVRVIVPPAAPSAVAPPRANGVRPTGGQGHAHSTSASGDSNGYSAFA